jgi:pyruvate ferredoxin oxidoreductase gamma subunit/2-oxoisovalerate ferredoxin oxidoreductase gamma subunit
MLEIRFHGRGGQGTVVATILMAKAFFDAGHWVQSFPLFGVERRGAPVEAYLRVSTRQIWKRTNVYKPDHIVVQDETLLRGVDVTQGLKPGGWILVNSSADPSPLETYAGFQFAWVDATSIAINNRLGTRTHPIVNTAMMGALARVLGMPPMEAVAAAIREEFAERSEPNIEAAKEACECVRILGPIGLKSVG